MLLLELGRQTPRFSPPSQHHGAPTHEQAGQACSATRSCTTTRHRGKRKAMHTGVPEVGHAGNCLQQPEPGDGPAHEHQRTAQDHAGLQNTDLSCVRVPITMHMHHRCSVTARQMHHCRRAKTRYMHHYGRERLRLCQPHRPRHIASAPPAPRGCFACCALVPCA